MLTKVFNEVWIDIVFMHGNIKKANNKKILYWLKKSKKYRK